MVLRWKEDLISCIERDANDLLGDFRFVRDFVTTEYKAGSDMIRKRGNMIHDFRCFAEELLNEGSASAVADVARILNQRALEIRAHSRKFGIEKPSSVEVMFHPLGLPCQPQATDSKINLIGRVTVTIIRTDVPQPELHPWSMPQLTTWIPSENTLKFSQPVFEFTASSSSVKDRPKARISGRHRVKDSGALRRSTPSSRSNFVIRQRQQLNEVYYHSSSSDEEGFANSDEDADAEPAAEAVMENLSAAQKSSPDSINDLSSSLSIVLFSHEAKLRRFVDGYWCTGVVGNLEIVRLQDKNITYLSMKNKQV